MHALLKSISLNLVIFYFFVISASAILFDIVGLYYERALNWEYLTVLVRKTFIISAHHLAWFLNLIIFDLVKNLILLCERLHSKVRSQLLTWNQRRISCRNLVCLHLADRKTIKILFWNKTGGNIFFFYNLGAPGNAHAKLWHTLTLFLN